MNPDVIIIGAGVIGTACAYFLSRLGIKVLILERRHLCAGASGASAALIVSGGTRDSRDPLERFRNQSQRLLQEIVPDFDRSIEMIRGGSLMIADTEQTAMEFQWYASHSASDCTYLNGSDARRMEPLLGARVLAALYNPGDFHVNPFRLCEAYLSAAVRSGCRVEYGVNVQAVQVENGRIDRVITDTGDYHSASVVVSGGADTARLLKTAGIQVPIVPARGQVILTEALPETTRHILFFPDHLYIKQTASGNFYLGSHTEFVGFENRITLEKITAYVQALSRSVPVLRRMQAIRFFAGFRPLSQDEIPVIGPVPECPQLIVASGHGRSGMMLSAGTGKGVSELIADGRTQWPIDKFRVSRFDDHG